ncbi:MAG: NUDIX domain-containing protein [Pseudomonadales bacterium]|nr:NUDIX domain-containing protein [Pseudomonadales bacterium]
MQCNEDLKKTIGQNLMDFDHHADTNPEHRRAAVAITVTDVGPGTNLPGIEDSTGWSDRAALMLTRRSAKLRNHPGQWAFPGGRVDPGETLIEAALRELSEEVHVHVGEEQVLGILDDFITRSGFAMTPVVVWGGPDLQARPNPGEVESIHRIPIEEFFRDDAPLLDEAETSEHPILRMPVGDDYIAAPTAALIYQFREVAIAGRATRVAHYEQPEFAWK